MPRLRSLSEFIRHHHADIIGEFETFARSFTLVSLHMTAAELQDHAAEILTAVVADMETPQSASEQTDKSIGLGTRRAMEISGHLHADARLHHRFSAAEVIAEFRALRASVLALYDSHDGEADLTGVRRFNEALDEALCASMVRFSERMDHYKDQFVGVLSHDLRAPLNAITAGAALLAMPIEGEQHRARVSTLILGSAARMNGMIADLLDLTRSRLGSGIPIDVTQGDLGEICARAILELRVSHPTREIRYERIGNLNGCWDAPRLMQVVTNLLGNALDHGDQSAVEVTARDAGADVTLTVRNFGPPIPRELQASIFDPMVQHGQPGRRNAQGLGLGLFIVRAIVIAHGGVVTVTSNEEVGTTFEVRLPKAPQ